MQPPLELVDLSVKRFDYRYVGAQRPPHVLVESEGLHALRRQPLHRVAAHPGPGLARQHVLYRQYLGRAAPHQLHVLACQIPHRTRRQADITAGQDPQPQQLRQVRRIVFVVAVLNSDRSGRPSVGPGVGTVWSHLLHITPRQAAFLD